MTEIVNLEGMSSGELSAQLDKLKADHETALVRMAKEYDSFTDAVDTIKKDGPTYTVEVIVRSADGKKREVFAKEEPMSSLDAARTISELANQARAHVTAPQKRLLEVQTSRNAVARRIQTAKEEYARRSAEISRAIDKAREQEARRSSANSDVMKHEKRTPPARNMMERLVRSGDISAGG